MIVKNRIDFCHPPYSEMYVFRGVRKRIIITRRFRKIWIILAGKSVAFTHAKEALQKQPKSCKNGQKLRKNM